MSETPKTRAFAAVVVTGVYTRAKPWATVDASRQYGSTVLKTRKFKKRICLLRVVMDQAAIYDPRSILSKGSSSRPPVVRIDALSGLRRVVVDQAAIYDPRSTPH